MFECQLYLKKLFLKNHVLGEYVTLEVNEMIFNYYELKQHILKEHENYDSKLWLFKNVYIYVHTHTHTSTHTRL